MWREGGGLADATRGAGPTRCLWGSLEEKIVLVQLHASMFFLATSPGRPCVVDHEFPFSLVVVIVSRVSGDGGGGLLAEIVVVCMIDSSVISSCSKPKLF